MLYRFEDYCLDTDRRELRQGSAAIELEPQVFDLLAYLIDNRERVVSKADLLASVWQGRIVSESALSSRINAVRCAIGDSGEQQRLIRTFPRKGLRFVGATRVEQRPVARGPDARAVDLSEIAPALPDKPSVAVLSFTNMSGDPEQDYFAAGMAEDITTALSKVRWFFVVSRNSPFANRGQQVDVKQVAQELGVRYVLEGSVRKSGTRARVTAQLLDATSGRQVWAERYDRELGDIFAVQDEITEQVVAAIEPQLYGAEGIRAKRKLPENLDAWECVVRALFLINSRAGSDIAVARTLLEKAIALDPGYAQALSLLSFVTTLGVHMGWEPREATLRVASNAAHKALQLDADEPWAHLALGYVLAWSRRAGDAIAAYEKALTLNPNFAIAHWLLALALCYLGRSEEALVHGDKAARLSPRDLLARGNSGVSNNVRAAACFVGGHYREGMAFAHNAILESPNLIPAYRALIVNCALAGEIEEAAVALQSLKTLVPDISLKLIKEMMPFVRADEQQRWLEGFRLSGLK